MPGTGNVHPLMMDMPVKRWWMLGGGTAGFVYHSIAWFGFCMSANGVTRVETDDAILYFIVSFKER